MIFSAIVRPEEGCGLFCAAQIMDHCVKGVSLAKAQRTQRGASCAFLCAFARDKQGVPTQAAHREIGACPVRFVPQRTLVLKCPCQVAPDPVWRMPYAPLASH